MVSFVLDNAYKVDDPILAKKPLIAPQPYFDWWAERYRWGLRDVSLTPDWPETSHWIQDLLYQEEVGGHLTGVIGINPGFIQSILQTTGPVQVLSLPEYNETVDANNFAERIHYHQDVDENNQNISFLQRKRFTRYLAQAVLSKIKTLPKTKLGELGKDVTSSLDQKDILIYLSDPAAERIIDTMGWSGRVGTGKFTSTIGTANSSDYMYVVDTNVGGNKTNRVVSQIITDNINLSQDGSATHYVTLSYNYTGTLATYEAYAPSLSHVAYNRLYIPAGSRIIARDGFDDTTGVVHQYGLDVWGQAVSVEPNKQRQFEFSWQTPALYGPTMLGDSGSYSLIVQRQPGAIFTYHIEVKPPEGIRIVNVSGPGSPVINPDGSATLYNSILNSDAQFKLTLQKKT